MSNPDPLEPNNIARKLIWLSQQLDAAAVNLAELDEKATRAKLTYEVGFSRAFLSSSGAMDARKHHAVVETEREKLEWEIAEQVVRAGKERIKVLYSQVEICRSLNAAGRAQWNAA